VPEIPAQATLAPKPKPGTMAPRMVLRWLYVTVAAANLLVLAIAAQASWQSRERYRAQALAEVENISKVLQSDLVDMVGKIDLSLLAVSDEFSREEAGDGLTPAYFQAFLSRQAKRLPEVEALRIDDAKGRRTFDSSIPADPAINLADRPRFAKLRDNPQAGLVIDPPVDGRVSRKWVVIMARRLNHSDGAFAGEVVAAVDVARFMELFASLDLGGHGFVALRDPELRIMARYPDVGVMGQISMTPQIGGLAASGVQASGFEAVSNVDGYKRMSFFRRVPGSGLYLSLGLAEVDYLAPWRREVWRLGAVAGLFVLATWVLVWRMRRSVLGQARAYDELGRYRQMVESTADMMCVVGPDYAYTTANQAFLDLHGLGREQVIGRPVPEVAGQEAFTTKIRPAVDRCLAGETIRAEGQVDLPGKGLVYISVTMSPVRDSSQAVTGVVFNLRDVTKEMEREQSLSRAKARAEGADRAKSEFLANTSHEIRTPLGGVLSMLQVLESDELTPEQRECVTLAAQAGHNLLVILNDILDLSKIEAGRMEIVYAPFCLRELAESACAMFLPQAREKGLCLSCQVDAALPEAVLGDAPRLRQILFNLVGNAVKFTQTGSVRVLVHPEGNSRVCFTVADTGIGIPADKLEAVFEPFIQADGTPCRTHQGTGLGLAIVKRLAELMGGAVELRSTPGQGTEVRLILPLKPAGSALPDKLGKAPARLLSARILLVEDDRINQLAARRILEKGGHSVTCAQNGHEALDILGSLEVDAVLMDIQMPVMDGLTAVGRIRAGQAGQGNKAVPVVALTAHAMKGDEENLLAAGFDAYLSKPLDVPQLMATLARLVKG